MEMHKFAVVPKGAARELETASGHKLGDLPNVVGPGEMQKPYQHNGIEFWEFLALLNQTLSPKSYLEIGTHSGASLAMFACDAICIDPSCQIDANVIGKRRQLHFYQMTSDEYFSEYKPSDHFPDSVDVALIDGLHLFENVLRDFINVEHFRRDNSIILIHDCLPTNQRMAERTYRVGPCDEGPLFAAWTGDVWKIAFTLKAYRPDLRIMFLDCPPTGLMVVTQLQPTSDILQEKYEKIIGSIGKLELTDSVLHDLWSIYPTVGTSDFARWPEKIKELFTARTQVSLLLTEGEMPLVPGPRGTSFAGDITETEARELAASLKRPLQAFEVFPGVRLAGAYDPRGIWEKLGLAHLCAGKRVLEIGPAEGFYTKQLAEAGADVTAIDYRSKEGTGFYVMERLSGRNFQYIQANILDADPAVLGTFDIVLFMGVLYHLPDLVRALDNCRSLCQETLLLESLCDNSLPADIPVARYFPSNSASGDWTTFWAPNRLCLHGMLMDCGFEVIRDETWSDRMLIEARVVHRPGARLKPDMAYSRETM